MIVKLLIEHHFEFLSLKRGCTGSSEPTLAKMSNCCKSHSAAHFVLTGDLCLLRLVLRPHEMNKRMKTKAIIS